MGLLSLLSQGQAPASAGIIVNLRKIRPLAGHTSASEKVVGHP